MIQSSVATLEKDRARAGPTSGAQPMSEASALAEASAVGLSCGLRRGAAPLDLHHLGSSEPGNITLKEHLHP